MKIETRSMVCLIGVIICLFVFCLAAGFHHLAKPPKCVTTVQYSCPTEFGWISLHSQEQIDDFMSTHSPLECDIKFINVTAKYGGYGDIIKEGCD